MFSKTLSDLFQESSQITKAAIHCHIPAKVTAVDRASATCSVQVLIAEFEPDSDDPDITLFSRTPIITGVPIIMPYTAAGGMLLPVSMGDICLLCFSDRSIDTWVNNRNEIQDAVLDFEQHGVNSPFAVVGAGVLPELPQNDVVIKKEGGEQITVGSGVVLGKDGTQKAVLGTSSDDQVSAALEDIAGGLSDIATALTSLLGACFPASIPAATPVITQTVASLAGLNGKLMLFRSRAETRLSSTIKLK